MVNWFEVAGCDSYISFCDGEVGEGSGGVNAICSQPEVPDDVIYGDDVDTFQFHGKKIIMLLIQ